nr:tRNA(Ile)-lysidine synthase [Candidatus Cloacimonadota bacterium]
MSLTNEYQKRLIRFLDQEQILHKGEKLLLAVSAGADSTAMLYLFSRLRYSYSLSLLAVHINHQLRGEESIKDEQQVKKLCTQLSIPLVVRRITLEGNQDLENRARKARFEVFEQILINYRFNKVLLAHHKWDLAETVLLNLFRGSGLTGMGGIRALQGNVMHPMLEFDPLELKALLKEVGLSWREDKSNIDLRFTRNRLRVDLIPHLAEYYNPQIRQKLAEEAQVLQQADEYILEKSLRRFKKICLENSNGRIILSIPDLLKAPSIEHYYIFREAFRQVSGMMQDFFRIHYDELSALLETQGSKYISLPHGVLAIKRYQELLFTKNEGEVQAQSHDELLIEADRSRAVHMDYRFHFKYLKVLPQNHREYSGYRVILDADRIAGSFVIRSRRDGDHFMPLGMTGFKKLKDFFIDEKVAKYDRDSVPIFDDGEKIFWVCGHRLDERVRYTAGTTRFLMIEAVSLSRKPNRAANRKKRERGNNEFNEL